MRKIKPKVKKKNGMAIPAAALRQLGAMGRSKVLMAMMHLHKSTHIIRTICDIPLDQRPDGSRLLALLDAMTVHTSSSEAVWQLGAVINSTFEMVDFTPPQAQRLAAQIHRLATPSALAGLPWERGVILRKYLSYGLLVYEAERSTADWEMTERCAREAVAILAQHAPKDALLPELYYQLGLTLLNRRDVNNLTERLWEAESWFNTANTEAQSEQDIKTQKRALLNLALVNDALSFEEPGRLLKAVDFFDELVQLDGATESDAHVYRQALLNRGWALLRFPPDRQPKAAHDAISDLTESVRLSREANEEAHLAHGLYMLGLAHDTLTPYEFSQANHDQALAALGESLNLYIKLRDRDGLSRVFHNIGLVYDHKNQYNAALEYYQKALPFRAGRAIEEWETLGNIADIRVKPETPSFGAMESDGQLLARIDALAKQHVAQGSLELALRSHRYGLRLVAHAESDEPTAQALRERADRAVQAAENAWSAARDEQERNHLSRWLGTFYASRGWLGVTANEAPEALLDRIARGKARSFRADRERRTNTTVADQRANQDLADKPINRAALHNRLRRTKHTAFIDLSTSALGTTALVAYLNQSDELVLSAQALAPTEELVSGWLQHPQNGWLSKLEQFRRSPKEKQLDALEPCVTGMQAVLDLLYQDILGPSLRGLRQQGILHLVFSVHGPIAALPLSAAWYLVDGAPRYLIEDFLSVVLVPSVQFFLYPEVPRPLQRCVHVLGNDPPQQWKADAQALCAAWRTQGLDVTSLTNPTAEQLLNSMGQVDVVHAVCHGFFDPWRLSQSGILLGGDELLSCERILAHPAQIQTSLVVVCACRSGRSRAEDFGGEWLGLPGVLLRAGVQSVIAGLWDVDYEATESLSRAFYRNLFDAAKPPAVALAESLRAALAEGRAAAQGATTPTRLQRITDEKTRLRMRRLLDAPWFWAGLQLISDSGC